MSERKDKWICHEITHDGDGERGRRDGQPIHPEELGPEDAAAFVAHAEAVALAIKDRLALLEWIEKEFDVEWLPK